MRKMKVGTFVCGSDIFEDRRGMGTRAKAIFEILQKEHDATLIARTNKRQVSENIISVWPAKTKLWPLKLIPILLKNKFDYIYCVTDWISFMVYYIFSKICKYKIIYEATGFIAEQIRIRKKAGMPELKNKLPLKFYQIMEKLPIKYSDYIITEAEYLLEFFKKYNEKISIIPLFIDEEVFKNQEELSNYKVERDIKTIGLIGPFDTPLNKAYLDFLHANFDRFSDKINFKLIGACDDKIENERITYTGYLESTQDYVEQLCSLDAAVIVPKPLNFGPYTKIVECMACSVPVFTTPAGVLGHDYVKPGRDILVFEEEELVDKVNELIFDDELMDKVGKYARIVIEKYYSKRANERKLADILEQLNANSKSGHPSK